jgi:hypothetical protein
VVLGGSRLSALPPIGLLPVLLEKVNPFTWTAEFPAEMARGGFNVIVGNPQLAKHTFIVGANG